MMIRPCLLACVGFVGFAGSADAQTSPPASPATTAAVPRDPISAKNTTVVWVSIDGFRHDYLERFNPPTLCRLRDQGAFTTQETPIFPSLTFPNHIAQVTGVGVAGHGVPMNGWYDEQTRQSYSFPDQSALLRAEPIWITATKQGVRTMCVDWPMSDNETGPVKAAFFDAAFDTDETDGHRLDRIVDGLNADDDPTPYRLVMGYMSGVDHAGHAAPQSSPQIRKAVLQADADVDHFVQGITAWFGKTHGPDDELVMVFSTDHGMTTTKELVNLDRLIGADLVKGIKIVTSGPMATIHTMDTPPDRADKIVERLKQFSSFLTAWKAADVPADKQYADPSRVGQVVVMLKPGYSLSRTRLATTLPVPRESGGNHGYDPAGFPDMQGSAIIWRLRHPIGGVNFGYMKNTQWDATVCTLLGISPPLAADPRSVLQ